MPNTVQFVDTISATPATRLDLNDGSTWKVLQSPPPDLSPPPLKRSVVSSMLRDGSEIPATAYDNRTLDLTVLAAAASKDLLATELQKLSRELDRTRNILKYTSDGATKPVFFRTLRSPEYKDIGARQLEGQNKKMLRLKILAEPFAYGLRETVSGSPFTVNNDPAAGSNPCYFDVTGVLGEVPTPGLFVISGLPSGDRTLMAIRRHGTPGGVYALQCEGMTQGTDTTTQPNDATFSGGSNNYSRTTFATATLATRLTAPNFPVTGAGSSVEYRGLYRIFARLRKTASGDDIRVQMRWGSDAITSDEVTLPLNSNRNWIDLGLVQLPAGIADPVNEGYSGVAQAVKTMSLEFRARQVSGTGNLDWDVVLAVPADEGLIMTDWRLPTPGEYVLDGPNQAAYQRDAASTVLATSAPIGLSGGFLELAPNQTNRIAFLEEVNPVGGGTTIGDSNVVAVHYWPRYLYIRPN
jgi:hypothetical protein